MIRKLSIPSKKKKIHLSRQGNKTLRSSSTSLTCSMGSKPSSDLQPNVAIRKDL